MRITQLSLAGRGAWPDLHLDRLSATLNIFYAPPRAGKSSVAQLAGHLLYGKSDGSWRQHFGQAIPRTEGSISVENDSGSYVLRRHQGPSGEKLTIASSDGHQAHGRTVRSLLKNLSPELAAQLYAVDFAESPVARWLLSEDFSRQYSQIRELTPVEFTAEYGSRTPSGASEGAVSIDRRRVDELVTRRNQIACEIEQQLSVERREDGVLERELANVDDQLVDKREQLKKVREKLRVVETQLADVEARLRYASLESSVTRETTKVPSEHDSQELQDLDTEITRCRQAIADCKAREIAVRTELARLSPDGTADAVTCLADGRTTLTVMERLLDDLDAEVAQLARANQPGRGLGANVHAKISPVAKLLRQQVYTLCGQLTEQERAAWRQQALVESRQLSRTQNDLSERLEHLLSRREALVQKTRRISQPMVLSPQKPAGDHCRCARHGRFVIETEKTTFDSNCNQETVDNACRHRSDLEQKRTALLDQSNRLQREIDGLESHWKDLQLQRGGLLGSASLEQRRTELHRLETIINQSLHATVDSRSTARPAIWRASDVLAQLTDGELVQIHLDPRGERTKIINRAGSSLHLEALSPAQHDALYLALTLALVASHARRGIELPLVLDEPFLRQDVAGTEIMAGVLVEFARTGRQLLVFTEDRDAQRRFSALGEAVFDLDELRRKSVVPATAHEESTVQASPVEASRLTTRVTREATDGYQSPTLSLASVNGGTNGNDSFYLSEASSLAEFPVLGADTTDEFAQLSIRTVGDLLSADAADIAQRLGRDKIRPETVELWQRHMGLMCYVPGVSLNDAQLLLASGIMLPTDLRDADANNVVTRVSEFCKTKNGQRILRNGDAPDRETIERWIASARSMRTFEAA